MGEMITKIVTSIWFVPAVMVIIGYPLIALYTNMRETNVKSYEDKQVEIEKKLAKASNSE